MGACFKIRPVVLGVASVSTALSGCVYRNEMTQFDHNRLVRDRFAVTSVGWLDGVSQNVAANVVCWLVIGGGFASLRTPRRPCLHFDSRLAA